MQNLINESVFKATVQKILNIIKNHQHKADEILDTDSKKILTAKEREKIDKLVINDMDGNKVLHNDGTYKITGSVNLIDDTQPLADKTYSSNKLKELFLGKSDTTHNHKDAFDQKADKTDLHKHENKNVLDDISLTKYSRWEKVSEKLQPDSPGLGTKILFDDLTFKEFSGNTGGTGVSAWQDLTDKPFDSISELDFNVAEEHLFLKYPTVPCTKAEYLRLKSDKKLDINTVYIIIDDNSNTGSGNDNSNSVIVTDGDGTALLFNNGTYKKIIDDNLDTSADKTYSIDKLNDTIDHRVTDAIANATDTSMRIWQKTKLSVKANDVFDAFTTENDILNAKPVIVQGYKFIEGDTDVVEIIKTFDNAEKDNFICNENLVDFSDYMQIKNYWLFNMEINPEGYYESPIISKTDYVGINGMEVV